MSATTTQMNARIESDLKRSGDEALRNAGYTPSQAIRGLWDFAARHRHDPAAIRSVLEADGAGSGDEAESGEKRAQALERMAAGPRIISSAREQLGIPDARSRDYSDDDLREWAHLDRLAERGLA